MAKEKTPPHKVVMTEGKRKIIRGLLSEYDIQSAQDIQNALKDLLGGTIKEMRNVRTAIITVTATNQRQFNPASVKSKSQFHRTESQLLSHKL